MVKYKRIVCYVLVHVKYSQNIPVSSIQELLGTTVNSILKD